MEYWEELWNAADPAWRENPPEMAVLEPGPCDYLPGRIWSLRMLRHASVDRLMLLGGQRFGYAYCVTSCPSCRACVPARIRVADFSFSKSQRRTIRKNADLKVTVEPVAFTPEKFQLLTNFVGPKFGTKTEHLGNDAQRAQYYLSFHMHHPAHSREIHYKEEDRLLGISILDFGQHGLYSHYFFWDTRVSERRLGIYSFLKEISWCQKLGLPYLYIGFLNEQTPALSYKSQFDHLEVLLPEVGWVPHRALAEKT